MAHPQNAAAVASRTATPPTDPIDFQVFTSAIEPDATYAYTDDLMRLVGKPELRDELAALPRPQIPMVGSSTERDLQHDRMTLSALQDMTQCEPNLSIFLNHDYTLPESLYGSMQGAPSINIADGIADLQFVSDVELLNPRAVQTYLYSVRGRKMGVSGGFMVLEMQWVDAQTEQPVADEDVDFWDIIAGRVLCDITHVKMVEQSVVGVPANQRSWVESAIKGLFGRTHNPKLAPIVRSLWPQQYGNLLSGVTNPALYQELREMQPRQQKALPVIYWMPDSGEWRVAQNKHARTVTRAEVTALLKGVNKEPPMHTASTPTVTKAATGKSDWPLAERDHAWDSGEAHKRLLAWAGGNDDLDVGKFKSVHFYSPDGDDAQNVSAYKLAFCDIISGEVKAIPRAIFACAGAHGVDATTGIPADEKDAIKSKITAYYHRMAKEFGDDALISPFEDKALTPDVTKHADPAPPVAEAMEATPDAAKAAIPDAADVEVASDGSHPKCKGTHTHSHPVGDGSQGGDETHTHQHTHDGDNSHSGAAHDGGSHEKGAQADKTADAQPHEHAPAVGVAPVALQQSQLIEMYGKMLAPLGLRVIESSATPDAVKCGWTDDQEQAIRAGIAAVDAASDALMRVAGVPDADDFGGDDDEDNAAAMPYAGPTYGRMSLDLAWIDTRLAHLLTTKEGKRHSEADMAHIQAIHDHCMSLGAQCSATSGNDDTPSDGQANNQDMQDARQGVATGKGLAALEALTASFTAAADTWKTAGTSALQQQLATLQQAVATLTTEKDALAEAFDRYSQTPLGRPTRPTGTATQTTARAADPAAVTLAQLQAPSSPADARAALYAQTSVQYVKGVGKVRQWPDNAGAGQRPALTAAQIDVLRYLPNGDAIREAYDAGRAAGIPIVDDAD